MLAEAIVRSIRDVLVASQVPGSEIAARILNAVLEEPASVFPASNEGPKPEVPAEKTLEERQIEDLQAALTATRERAEKAEQKYVELKRNGG